MKKTLIGNLWLMIVAWCMYLNGFALIAMLIGISGTLILMIRCEADHKRCIILFVILYGLVLSELHTGTIPYFFPDLYMFMAIVIINAAATNEYYYAIRNKSVLPMLSVILVACAVLSLVIFIVPDADYSLFKKSNLFLMESFIFLPYLLPMLYSYAYKWLIGRYSSITKTAVLKKF